MIAALLLGGIYGVNYLIPQEGIMAQTMTAQAADGKLQISTGSGTTESGNNLSDTATKTPSDTSYTSLNVSVQITRNSYNTNRLDKSQGGKHIKYGTNISYVLADIYVSDITCLQTCFAQNTYGVGYDEKLSDMSARMKSVLAVNGDSYSNSRHKSNGTIIRNGVI